MGGRMYALSASAAKQITSCITTFACQYCQFRKRPLVILGPAEKLACEGPPELPLAIEGVVCWYPPPEAKQTIELVESGPPI
jgi:hypothetical protein